MLLLDRISTSSERRIAAEITAATRQMAAAWEVSGIVPDLPEHEKRITAILENLWRASIEALAGRIEQELKSTAIVTVKKELSAFDLFVIEYLAEYGGEKIRNIWETTRKQVMTQVFMGTQEGLGQRDTAKLIMQNAPIIGRQRANVIARTESHSAANYGSLKQAQRLSIQMQREWIAESNSNRTRDTHKEASGKVVAMDEPFKVGTAQLMYPGDPDGPPEESINCRCAVGYVVED